MRAEKLGWSDPWLQSLDLEYHNINPDKGLFFGVTPAKRVGEWNNNVRRGEAALNAPLNTRASGRAHAVAAFQKSNQNYVINWDSIAVNSRDFLVMGDPFKNYVEEVTRFFKAKQSPESER